ncbi:MAG: hypothetical protein MZW92_76295 [Comamonadaceae bacterium]|nr:hypothetical protein [Comamonadaceae bacterium]
MMEAIRSANQEAGGSVLETGRGRVHGARHAATCRALEDFRAHPARRRPTAARRCCWATWPTCSVGPEMRRGIAELDGEGEVVGGIIVMRSGKNALRDHRRGQGEARRAASAACRRAWRSSPTYDRSDADRARRRQPERQAGRGVRRRGAGLRRVPVPPALGAGGDRDRCRSACWPPSSSCS